MADEATHLRIFHAVEAGDWLIGRTGYTGEDGLEVLLPAAEAPVLWRRLLAAGITPCGLGARDTLRLEAGLALYGHDLDENHTPLESGLAWTLAWIPEERRFVGREALETQQANGIPWRQIGVMLEGPGVMRDGALLYGDHPTDAVGIVTSGGFSPTLNRSIALARLDPAVKAPTQVVARGHRLPVRRVDPPFVRFGQIRVPL
ncbi:aminomethyltransferase (fragment) [Gammaproteobacteria bacterium]